MSGYHLSHYEHSLTQLELSRTAADRYALRTALAQVRAGRRGGHGTPARRLRRAVARYLASTARLVDAS